MKPALQKEYPGSRQSFRIFDDNDPTGNQSKKCVQAKKENKLTLFQIPQRSPGLNVLDFAIWNAVERKLRIQAKSWPASRHETRAQFESRLDRTARSLPAEFINKSIVDLARRCYLLHESTGGLFQEGGRRRRPL